MEYCVVFWFCEKHAEMYRSTHFPKELTYNEITNSFTNLFVSKNPCLELKGGTEEYDPTEHFRFLDLSEKGHISPKCCCVQTGYRSYNKYDELVEDTIRYEWIDQFSHKFLFPSAECAVITAQNIEVIVK